MHRQLFFFTCILVAYLAPANSYGQMSNVKLSGTVRDSNISSIEIVKAYGLWHDFDAPVEKIRDVNHILEFKPERPGLYNMMVLGRTIRLYISPGDQLNFTIDRVDNRPSFHFTGKNENNYNYATESEAIFRFTPWLRKGQSVDSFKHEVNKWYDERVAFLQNYHTAHPLTKDAYRVLSEDLKYEYTYLLYYPLTRSVKQSELPGDYFTNVKVHPDYKTLLHLSEYSMLVFTYRNILYPTGTRYEQIDSIYQNIQHQFRGVTREYMITNLIGVFAKKQKDSYHNKLIHIINEAPRYVKDTTCLQYIQRCKDEYTLLNRPFPLEILNKTLLTDYESNKKLKLSEVLDQYKGQPVYISFWASWCGACREDHKDAALANAYLKDKKVVHLYLSLDKKQSEKAWKNAAIADSITTRQYLVEDDLSSVLVKFFTIRSIPRYVLLDKDHLLKNTDAPRPNSYQFPELKRHVDLITAKIVRFN